VGGGRVEEMQAVASDGRATVAPGISVDSGGSTRGVRVEGGFKGFVAREGGDE
jgi:hypothetical protein